MLVPGRWAMLLLVSLLAACSAPRPQAPSARDAVDDIADRYYGTKILINIFKR